MTTKDNIERLLRSYFTLMHRLAMLILSDKYHKATVLLEKTCLEMTDILGISKAAVYKHIFDVR